MTAASAAALDTRAVLGLSSRAFDSARHNNLMEYEALVHSAVADESPPLALRALWREGSLEAAPAISDAGGPRRRPRAAMASQAPGLRRLERLSATVEAAPAPPRHDSASTSIFTTALPVFPRTGTRPGSTGEQAGGDPYIGSTDSEFGDRTGTTMMRTGAAAASITAAHAIPKMMRMAIYGDGTHRPPDALESADGSQLIPGRWATNYGESTRGYQEDQHGGAYLKKLQNLKPLPMWWRYNGKTTPPWFQPNEPLQRAHLLRSPVPVPAPPFRTPFTPAWARGPHAKPPQPAEFPYKHPMSMPWGGDGMMQCTCPGNPNLMCDCLSIQYPVELPTPETGPLGNRVDMDKKMARRATMLIDELLQPNLLENLLGVLLSMVWGWGDMRLVPRNVAKANPSGLGTPVIMLAGTALWFLIRMFLGRTND